jgi:hypothetical protein
MSNQGPSLIANFAVQLPDQELKFTQVSISYAVKDDFLDELAKRTTGEAGPSFEEAVGAYLEVKIDAWLADGRELPDVFTFVESGGGKWPTLMFDRYQLQQVVKRLHEMRDPSAKTESLEGR